MKKRFQMRSVNADCEIILSAYGPIGNGNNFFQVDDFLKKKAKELAKEFKEFMNQLRLEDAQELSK